MQFVFKIFNILKSVITRYLDLMNDVSLFDIDRKSEFFKEFKISKEGKSDFRI